MYRQGEIIIQKVDKVKGKKLNHLILAEGEATGHKHEITEGEAELYQDLETLFLLVNVGAELTHPDHKPVSLPPGSYEIKVQREYVVGKEKYRRVAD